MKGCWQPKCRQVSHFRDESKESVTYRWHGGKGYTKALKGLKQGITGTTEERNDLKEL